MNENNSPRRTVTFVDGYSTLEVIINEEGAFTPMLEVSNLVVPLQLLHGAQASVATDSLALNAMLQPGQ
jgi:hypothetical protein